MLSYSQRAALCLNPTGRRLLHLLDEKQTNLCLSADVTSQKKLLQLADQLGPYICVLKTHVDILEDFTSDFGILIREIAEKHRFLIFEDRKFADIGNTVKLQYQKGIYRIADWSDFTNAHTVPGEGIIQGLKEVGLPNDRGLLLLAEMSSKGTLAIKDYTEKTVEMALKHRDFVFGFICVRKLTDDPGFVHMTPGVNLQKGSDMLGQQYLTPQKVIGELGNDVIIVGRGIYESSHPEKEAQEYRDQAWSTYRSRLS